MPLDVQSNKCEETLFSYPNKSWAPGYVAPSPPVGNCTGEWDIEWEISKLYFVKYSTSLTAVKSINFIYHFFDFIFSRQNEPYLPDHRAYAIFYNGLMKFGTYEPVSTFYS